MVACRSSLEEIRYCGHRLFFQVDRTELLARIQESDVQKFIWCNIICRFCFPHELVTDNAWQFTAQNLASFCQELNIKLSHYIPYRPQANGQAKSSKKIINILRKQLQGAKDECVDELSRVQWATRTTPRITTGESPYVLIYPKKAIMTYEEKRERLDNDRGTNAAHSMKEAN